MKPKLFIGSSAEALKISRAIQENLEADADVTVWTEDVFNLSQTTIDDLLKAVEENHFGIFIFHPDDTVEIRNNVQQAVRDNVIFELGMFIGKLGKESVFFLVPKSAKNLRLPSDLIGVNAGKYDDERADGQLKSALAPFCNQVRQSMESFYYNGLIGFDGETKFAREVAIKKPSGWHYLLSYEILKPRFDGILEKLADIENGLLFQRTKFYDFEESTILIRGFLKDMLQMFEITKNIITTEYEKSFSDTSTEYDVKKWCEKIISACNQLLEIEFQWLASEVYEGFEGNITMMRGWAKQHIMILHRYEKICYKAGNGLEILPEDKINFDFNVDMEAFNAVFEAGCEQYKNEKLGLH